MRQGCLGGRGFGGGSPTTPHTKKGKQLANIFMIKGKTKTLSLGWTENKKEDRYGMSKYLDSVMFVGGKQT